MFGVRWAMIAGLLITAAGCGGGGTTGSDASESGRISVRNDTQYHTKATYIGKDGLPIETDIPSGETKLITGDELIEGGTKVLIHLHVKAPYLIDRDIEVPVSGNVTVWVKRVVGRRDLEIEYLS